MIPSRAYVKASRELQVELRRLCSPMKMALLKERRILQLICNVLGKNEFKTKSHWKPPLCEYLLAEFAWGSKQHFLRMDTLQKLSMLNDCGKPLVRFWVFRVFKYISHYLLTIQVKSSWTMQGTLDKQYLMLFYNLKKFKENISMYFNLLRLLGIMVTLIRKKISVN